MPFHFPMHHLFTNHMIALKCRTGNWSNRLAAKTIFINTLSLFLV